MTGRTRHPGLTTGLSLAEEVFHNQGAKKRRGMGTRLCSPGVLGVAARFRVCVCQDLWLVVGPSGLFLATLLFNGVAVLRWFLSAESDLPATRRVAK